MLTPEEELLHVYRFVHRLEYSFMFYNSGNIEHLLAYLTQYSKGNKILSFTYMLNGYLCSD